jgi:hypothetical protein
MRLFDTSKSMSADDHDTVWELIPWYVNGSLPSEQIDMTQRHILTCAECTAEVARQQVLAKDVATLDPFAPLLSQSWDTIRARIKAEERAKKPRLSAWRWFEERQGRLIASGAAAAACLMLVVALFPADRGFRTLTSGTPGDQNTVKFQVVPNLDPGRLEAILAEHGLTLVGGPSAGGVYTATAVGHSDPKAASKGLMTAPEVLFAAPGE